MKNGNNYRPPRDLLREAAIRLETIPATAATRAIRESRDAERSTVLVGGRDVRLRRETRRRNGTVETYSIRVRVGAIRSDRPALVAYREDGRTVRLGLGESRADAANGVAPRSETEARLLAARETEYRNRTT